MYIERSDIWVKKMARKVGCFGDVLGQLAEPRADTGNTWFVMHGNATGISY